MEWEAKIIRHRGQTRIAVIFEKDPLMIEHIRSFEGATWSMTKSLWHLPDTPEYRSMFDLPPSLHDVVGFPGLAEVEKFRSYLSHKRYSPNSVKTYTECLRSFLYFFGGDYEQRCYFLHY